MLYDKRWDKQITTDPLSLESLITWLEKQPAETHYDYTLPSSCLIAQWLQASGATQFDEYCLRSERVQALFGGCGETIAYNNCDAWTFGAALERARAALALRPPLAS